MRKQQFEDSFFKLLDLLVALSEKVTYKRGKERVGNTAFHSFREYAQRRSGSVEQVLGDLKWELEINLLFTEPYIKVLTQVVRIIESENLSISDENLYLEILNSTLGEHEVYFLNIKATLYEDDLLLNLLLKHGICEKITKI